MGNALIAKSESLKTDHGLELATDAARQLGGSDEVLAVWVIGSVARGTAGPGSDLDLLAVTSTPKRPSQLKAQIRLDESRLSLACRSLETFTRQCERGAVFTLHVRHEGKLLYGKGGPAHSVLEQTATVPPDVEGSYRWASRELTRYVDLSPFNGLYAFVLGRLFAIGRVIAIARSIDAGKPVFGKAAPFGALAEQEPQLAAAIHRILELRSFNERAHGLQDVTLPFEHRDAHGRTREAVTDVGSLLPE